jgi:hypothetical protein
VRFGRFVTSSQLHLFLAHPHPPPHSLHPHSFTHLSATKTFEAPFINSTEKAAPNLDFSPSRVILSIFVGDKEADKMVADALIYHPTVSHYLKFVATTGTYTLTLRSQAPSIHPSPSANLACLTASH